MGGNYADEKYIYPDPYSFIQINVGGKKFTTLYKRLDKSMYFRELIRCNQKVLSSQKEIIIDRDGDIFRQVLLYLRTGLILANDKRAVKLLLTEAEFYQCEELAFALENKLDELSHQTPKKIGLEFIDLKKMFKEEQDQQSRSTYTLTKRTGDDLETYAIVDYINVFSRDEYKNNLCEHKNKDCSCYYYPKLVLVPLQKSTLNTKYSV
ncbi:BTB/POZ protein [Parasitella parasitica]|nr:BTB/POZ protein [Parasitella parasitica]